MRRSLAKGQPLLPEDGPLFDEAFADRYRRGMRPFTECTWCGHRIVLALAPARGAVCPLCDR